MLLSPVKDCNAKLEALNRDRDFPVNYVKAMREIVSSIFWVNLVRLFPPLNSRMTSPRTWCPIVSTRLRFGSTASARTPRTSSVASRSQPQDGDEAHGVGEAGDRDDEAADRHHQPALRDRRGVEPLRLRPLRLRGLRRLCAVAASSSRRARFSSASCGPYGTRRTRETGQSGHGTAEHGRGERRAESATRGEERDEPQKPCAARQREDGDEEGDVDARRRSEA